MADPGSSTDDEGRSEWCDAEDEYCRYLAQERHLFAWCLTRYGGVARAEAEQEALDAYPYEPASTPLRGLVFHDLAWHWAMLEIHGRLYWTKDRGLMSPSAEYHAEAARFKGADAARG